MFRFLFSHFKGQLDADKGQRGSLPTVRAGLLPTVKAVLDPIVRVGLLDYFWLGCNLCGRPFAIPGVSSIIVFCTHTFIVQLRYNFMFCLRQQVLAMVGVSNLL